MPFSRILVAVDIDDAEHAAAALTAAKALQAAQQGAGQVHILYVRHHLPVSYEGLLTSDFDTQEIEEARRLVGEWKEKFGLTDATFVSRRGRVRDQVMDEAEHMNADIIIIGSHQPSLGSRVFGSNAAAIVRNSPVSVLIARGASA